MDIIRILLRPDEIPEGVSKIERELNDQLKEQTLDTEEMIAFEVMDINEEFYYDFVPDEIKEIKKLLKERGITVVENPIFCG